MKLHAPLSLNQIATFRGVVDFYYWKGIPVARSWPRKPRHPKTPAQLATWQAFSDMMSWKKYNPISWHEQWAATALPPERSREDMKRKTGLQLAYAGHLYEPPVFTKVKVSPDPGKNKTKIELWVDYTDDTHAVDVDFRWLPYDGTRPPLSYVFKGYKCDRQNNEIPQYEPDFHGFIASTEWKWDAGKKKYELKPRAVSDLWQFYPIPKLADPGLLMLGAPYYTQDIPT